MKDRIKEIRKANGLTQQEFGEALGTTRQVITQYEAGTRTPGNAAIFRICETFGIREEWLRTGAGEMRPDVPRETQILAAINEIMKNSEEDVRMAIVNLLVDRPESDWQVLVDMILDVARQIESQQK